jgi:poly(glycerol-phosphate) alpha-glucosyltransferase
MNLRTKIFNIHGPRQFQYAPALRNYLLALDADLLHSHGIWQYLSIAVSTWHRKYRKPYVVTPHGMLDIWALGRSAWKKRLAWLLYEKSHFKNAGCIQALCGAEAKAIRDAGLRNPICIIPNGIDLPPDNDAQMPFLASLQQSALLDRKVLLFLGRIHPKKGLLNLLHAWKMILESCPEVRESWALALAGWDQNNHEGELQRLVEDYGIENSVRFLGPQFGADKSACYRRCDAFILPSFSEGLPMAVLEAWSFKKPVLITPECHLPEGFAYNAAIPIDPRPESIAKGLKKLFSMSDDERRTMGQSGFALVKARFSWSTIAAELKAVYGWLLGHETKPDSVRDLE